MTKDSAALLVQRALGDPLGRLGAARCSSGRGSRERRGGAQDAVSSPWCSQDLHTPPAAACEPPRTAARRPTWDHTGSRPLSPIGCRAANQRALSAAVAPIGRRKPAPGRGGAPFCSFLPRTAAAPTPEPRSGPPGTLWRACWPRPKSLLGGRLGPWPFLPPPPHPLTPNLLTQRRKNQRPETRPA